MSAVEMKKMLLTKASTFRLREKQEESWRAPNINQHSASLHYERPETERYISNAVLAKSKNRPSLPSPEEREYDLIK